MTDTTITPAASLDTLEGADQLVAAAIEAGIAAAEPQQVGEHGLAFLVPEGFTLNIQDERAFEDEPLPLYLQGDFKFAAVRSFAAYITRHADENTLGFINDLNGQGPAVLTKDVAIARYVLDDNPVGGTARRKHIAVLVLRPTTAARRWGAALCATSLSQEQLLDLVVEGIGEIAEPDGATLRDLISDLHAIRTTAARSVIRTGGQATVEVSDNVSLHAGTGNTVTIPEKIQVYIEAVFSGVTSPVKLDVTVKPIVRDEKVSFVLSAPALDDEITRVVQELAGDLHEATSIDPLWVP